MDPLLTLQGFAERRGVAYDPTDLRALRALQDASDFIRTMTGQVFDVVTDDEPSLDGRGRYGLLLPQLPVTAITEVATIDDSSVETILETTVYRPDSAGILWRLDGDVWPWGHANVRVKYTHGYAEVPSDIQGLAAALALANYYVVTTVGGVSSETLGNYAVTYDASAAAAASLDTKQLAILGRYRVAK